MTEHWNWEERYRTDDLPWDTGHPSSQLVQMLQKHPVAPCPALEVGCGTGTNAVWLAKQGFTVAAFDVSATAIDRARQRATEANVNVRFDVVDLLKAPDLGGPYQFFFDRGCYHCIREAEGGLQGYLHSVGQALGSGATGLVLTGNANEPRTGPPIVSREEIEREFGALFEIVQIDPFRFDPIPGEGVQPLGWSCLLRRR